MAKGGSILSGVEVHSVDEGRRVELRGFGVFFVSFRKPRLGRNPKTGDAVAIPAKRKLAFRAGINLKGKINAKPGGAKLARGWEKF